MTSSLSRSSNQMDKPLWVPRNMDNSHLHHFMKQLSQPSYEDLYTFSTENLDVFWSKLWDYCQIIGTKGAEPYIENQSNIEAAKFFPNARLNYAENLIEKAPELAIMSWDEHQRHRQISQKELKQTVAKIAQYLKSKGIEKGDRVAGYLPNIPETIFFMLAATSIGAVWSSCSPDFGVQGVVDRFGQIEPKILITTDGYFYNGKTFSNVDKINEIKGRIPSLRDIVVISFVELSEPHSYTKYEELLQVPDSELTYEPLEFNDPLFIMYSSGTTGVPKCIVHGVGGTLIQHLKEHQFHCDIHPGDRLFYFTTCGWMMWNWLVSGLASGATLMLYDGNPAYSQADSLLDQVEALKITHFGTSAKYIDSLIKENCAPGGKHKFETLKMILSTGSPLVPEAFDYVYSSIKQDVCLASISGGTDIVSCFALGNPIRPVWRGELQGRGLGMKVEVFDDEGRSVVGQKGELVCTAPFPSRPIGFWNDPDGTKYHDAYFSTYKNVWHHGDFVELTDHDGIIIYGRSDSVLNPGGVRIGTAEIYRQVEQVPEVKESIVIGQDWQGDVRVVLFVKLVEGAQLDDSLITTIKQQIRSNTTPRHVPAKIIQVTDIPRTKNGKIVEVAVRKAVHGEAIKNIESLANPEALEQYKDIPELLN